MVMGELLNHSDLLTVYPWIEGARENFCCFLETAFLPAEAVGDLESRQAAFEV